MTRAEWEKSTTALRQLLKNIDFRRHGFGGNRLVQYKFGAFYWGNRQMWVVYNGKADNVIATLRKRDSTLTIRYRANSIYSEIFKSRIEDWENFTIRRLPSETLGRHRGLARDNIGSRVRQAIETDRELRSIEEGVNLPEGVMPDGRTYEILPRLREVAVLGLMSNPRFSHTQSMVYDEMITQYMQTAVRRSFDEAYANLHRELDRLNILQANRGWTRVLDPCSVEFATEVNSVERQSERQREMNQLLQSRIDVMAQAQFMPVSSNQVQARYASVVGHTINIAPTLNYHSVDPEEGDS